MPTAATHPNVGGDPAPAGDAGAQTPVDCAVDSMIAHANAADFSDDDFVTPEVALAIEAAAIAAVQAPAAPALAVPCSESTTAPRSCDVDADFTPVSLDSASSPAPLTAESARAHKAESDAIDAGAAALAGIDTLMADLNSLIVERPAAALSAPATNEPISPPMADGDFAPPDAVQDAAPAVVPSEPDDFAAPDAVQSGATPAAPSPASQTATSVTGEAAPPQANAVPPAPVPFASINDLDAALTQAAQSARVSAELDDADNADDNAEFATPESLGVAPASPVAAIDPSPQSPPPAAGPADQVAVNATPPPTPTVAEAPTVAPSAEPSPPVLPRPPSRLMSVAGAAGMKLLAPLCALPIGARHTIAWVALVTFFSAACLWAFVFLRPPFDLEKERAKAIEAAKAERLRQVEAAKADEHAEASKDDAGAHH